MTPRTLTITGRVDSRVDPFCRTCRGRGWVCEDHPGRSWETGLATDCGCGGAGMPCACTRLAAPTAGPVAPTRR